jgi:hypothetical protein
MQRILEVLSPENRAIIAGERSRWLSASERSRWLSASERSHWPNFTFFIFPGIVLPFFYFSVVRKVPEKPVLFLPHPKESNEKMQRKAQNKDNKLPCFFLLSMIIKCHLKSYAIGMFMF